jgi:hypothetical protein
LPGWARVIAKLPGLVLHRTQPLLFRRIAPEACIVIRHIAGLQSVVCLRPRAAGIVRTEDAEQASSIFMEEPDEAVAKHGVGGLDHLRFEVVERVKRFFDVGHEARGWLGARGVQAVEEEMIIAGHGGVIEDCCVRGVMGVFVDEIAGANTIVDGP